MVYRIHNSHWDIFRIFPFVTNKIIGSTKATQAKKVLHLSLILIKLLSLAKITKVKKRLATKYCGKNS